MGGGAGTGSGEACRSRSGRSSGGGTCRRDAGGGVELNEMSDLVIQVMPSGEVAIATSFIYNQTRSPEGEVSTVKAFETDVWQKIDGEWKVVSLHYSEIPPDE